MTHTNTSANAQQQQLEVLRYAHLLDWGARLGVLALIASFAAYVFGVLTPHVPLEQLPSVWNLPVATYLQQTATPTGWGWLALAHKGDLSGLIGIAVLASCSIPPLLGLIPLYLKQRDYVYAAICTVVIAVLVLAASGVLTGGH
jgi:VIT1/CCC1 family predicted Fe2+/Mn2+ transporter